MAEALSPTNTLSQEHDVQLLIASKHLEKSHSDTITGYSSKQLEHFNHKALEDQLVGEFAVIVWRLITSTRDPTSGTHTVSDTSQPCQR